VKTPIIISVIFHCGVLTFASMDIPWFDSSDVRPMEIIPIEMVDISEVTKLQEIAKLPEPDQEKPEPPKRPERRAEMPPPPPRMQSSMPLPDSANQPAAKPKAPVKRAQAPTISERAKPKPPSRFSADRVAALLNKIPEEQSATDRLAERFAKQEQQMTSLDVRRQTMSISAAIQKKIEDQCWNPPSGALDAGSLKVKVYMYLTLDGELTRAQVEDHTRMNGPLKVAADSALRAVRMCAPYSDLKLPKNMYDQWREVIMNFDPSGMIS